MKEKFKDSALSPKERAEDLLPRLTLREKVGQVNQKLYGFQSYTCNGEHVELADSFKEEVEKWGGLGVLYGLYRADPWANKDYTTGLTGVNAIRAYNLAQHYVLEHSRFGIPMLMSSECPHGHQALDGYLLPVNLGMGAAWNPKLVEEGFKVVGEQQKEMGVDFALVSMLDILRDPRWGRSEECYGEDPYLCGQNAAAAVKGCASAGLEVVAKHFCAQGETTGGVNASAARIGERELREIHLPAMKEAVKAGATGVMAAYNEIDGVPCHANEWLLKDVLREGLGFDGIVMADGVAIDRLDMLTGNDKAANGAYALNAGVDVSLWDDSFPHLEEAVERGLVSEETLDKAVLRVLELKFARGLFEHPYLEEKPLTEYNVPKTFPQSLEIARQSAVLLKNNGVLPLKKEKKLRIAVIGPNADALYQQLGDYTPPLRDGVGVTVLDGIRNEFKNADVRYALGCTICDDDTSGIAEAEKLAEESDLIAAENKLKEQRSKIEEQNNLYKGIFAVFRPHLKKIKKCFAKAISEEEKEEALRLAVVYGVYLKRRSNFAMLAKNGQVQLSELLYAIRESTDALSFYGAAASVIFEGDGTALIGQVTFLYEFFEDCIESALPDLSACLVRLSVNNGLLHCRIALDNARESIPENWRSRECEKLGASVRLQIQDETLYATLSFGEREAIV